MMIFRWKFFCRCASKTLLVAFILLTTAFLFRRRTSCSIDEAEKALDATCLRDRHATGSAPPPPSLSVGAACDRLCSRRTTISKCLNYYEGGKLVWSMAGPETASGKSDDAAEEFDWRAVVVKRAKELPDELPLAFFRNARDDRRRGVTVESSNRVSTRSGAIREEFRRVVADSVKLRLSPGLRFDASDSHFIENLFGPGAFGGNMTGLAASLNAHWRRLQQDEFLYFSLLSSRTMSIPPVLGVCGAHYIVERFATFEDVRSSSSSLSTTSSLSTSDIVVSLLHLLREFEIVFNETLNICDMKLSNFGFKVDNNDRSGRGRYQKLDSDERPARPLTAALIDADSVAFDTQLGNIFRPPEDATSGDETSFCHSDEDCSYFDCRGGCRSSTKRCSPRRSDNNVRAFCRKILLSNLHERSPLFSILGTYWRGVFVGGGGCDGILEPSDFLLRERWREYRACLDDCSSLDWWKGCLGKATRKACSLRMIDRFLEILGRPVV